MSYIINIMVQILDFIYGITGSWGITIVGLTVLIRLILLPLTIKSARSTQAITAMQPELEKIQKKYKDDPERLNLEMMDLYSRYNANPATSCILPIIQLPILLAMFRSLESHPALKDGLFLGLKLGEPAMSQGTVYGVIVIVLTLLSSYLSMRFSPSMSADTQQQTSQKIMMAVMFVVLSYFSIKFSWSVSIYIITANLMGLVERLVVPPVSPAKEGAKAK